MELKDKANILAAQGCQGIVIKRADIHPVDQHRAAGLERRQRTEDVEQRRLTTSGLAHDGDEFAGPDAEIDSKQDRDSDLAEVGLLQRVGLDDDRRCMLVRGGTVCGDAIIMRRHRIPHRMTSTGFRRCGSACR